MTSAEPIEVAREVNRSWTSRPFARARELLLASKDWDAVERFHGAGLTADPIDPDVEVVVDAFPGAGRWVGQTGRDRWIRFWQQWVEPLDDLKLEDSNYEQVDEHVLVDMRVSARPRDGGPDVNTSVVQLFRIKEGAIRLYGVYPDRDEARAAIAPD